MPYCPHEDPAAGLPVAMELFRESMSTLGHFHRYGDRLKRLKTTESQRVNSTHSQGRKYISKSEKQNWVWQTSVGQGHKQEDDSEVREAEKRLENGVEGRPGKAVWDEGCVNRFESTLCTAGRVVWGTSDSSVEVGRLRQAHHANLHHRNTSPMGTSMASKYSVCIQLQIIQIISYSVIPRLLLMTTGPRKCTS